jgi:uncharacterized membrane protein YgdD (TMEM256/DUF423 family)
MKTTTFLRILYYLSWVLFVGLMVEAGSIAFNCIYTSFILPYETPPLWDLLVLKLSSKPDYLAFSVLMFLTTAIKAYLFYVVLLLFLKEKIDRPLSQEFANSIGLMAQLAILIAVLCFVGENYRLLLTERGIAMPPLEAVSLEGDGVWFLLGIVLLILSQILHKASEIQAENDLTI